MQKYIIDNEIWYPIHEIIDYPVKNVLILTDECRLHWIVVAQHTSQNLLINRFDRCVILGEGITKDEAINNAGINV